MRVLVIGDVHLKPWIFTRASEIMSDGIADCPVILGDIVDDWKQDFNIQLYEDTFDAATSFIKLNPSVLYVFGNHDLSYMWSERETGYSPIAKDTVIKRQIELYRLLDQYTPASYIKRVDNVLFMHGGLSRDFVEEHVGTGKKYDDIDYVVDSINKLTHQDMWNYFSPIWLRPQMHKNRMYKPRKILQVVGHTPVEQPVRQRNVLSCDLFSTFRDGTPIGTEQFVILDTKSWEFSAIK